MFIVNNHFIVSITTCNIMITTCNIGALQKLVDDWQKKHQHPNQQKNQQEQEQC